ncbi:hypothetical protein [Herbidospora mongoliensis]|uniref:hypothetical protein n=1 Tax=Herbidospora mongoliensis TaxID=688067 RepID=UPI000A5E132C|nr:hypothetical protein [Herbidospora mongoliensis]
MKRMIKAALVVATFGVTAMFAAPAQAANDPISDLLGTLPVGQLSGLAGGLNGVVPAAPAAPLVTAAAPAGWAERVQVTPMTATPNDVSGELKPALSAVTGATGELTGTADQLSGAAKNLTGSATQVGLAAQGLSGAVTNIVAGTRR